MLDNGGALSIDRLTKYNVAIVNTRDGISDSLP